MKGIPTLAVPSRGTARPWEKPGGGQEHICAARGKRTACGGIPPRFQKWPHLLYNRGQPNNGISITLGPPGLGGNRGLWYKAVCHYFKAAGSGGVRGKNGEGKTKL